jgi:putative membrane protein
LKDNEIAKSLETNASNANDELKKADKAAFDKAYLAQQITMHEQALDKLTNMLIPGAKDAAFKAHLEKTRGAVQSHLEHVKTLNSKLM